VSNSSGIDVEKGKINDKQSRLDAAIKTINDHKSNFQSGELDNISDAFSIQKFINKELDRLGQKYNVDYGHI
jgi:hypothetical protein